MSLFYKALKSIKKPLINNRFPNDIVNIQIKSTIGNISQKNKQCNTPTQKQKLMKHFYHKQMHYNYKPDENILKTLIKRNIFSGRKKKIKLIIYYQFKFTLGDCISENNSRYVGLTSTTLSRRLTMPLLNTSSIAQHLNKTFLLKNWVSENSYRKQ